MLKLRIAICLGLLGGTLTLVVGLINEARLSTILYRTMISCGFFGICGLLFGFVAENYLHNFWGKINDRGQKTADGKENSVELQGESSTMFSPFDPDNFENIARKKE